MKSRKPYVSKLLLHGFVFYEFFLAILIIHIPVIVIVFYTPNLVCFGLSQTNRQCLRKQFYTLIYVQP